MLEKEFENVVKEYIEQDVIAKEAKKVMDPLNKKIKWYMSSNKLKSFSTENGKVSYSTQTRTKMNEEALVEKLKHLGLHEAIKTVEVPNEQVIEELIFEGRLPASELQSCINTTYVEVLKVSK